MGETMNPSPTEIPDSILETLAHLKIGLKQDYVTLFINTVGSVAVVRIDIRIRVAFRIKGQWLKCQW